ncbi:hypothetical protein DSECCO2_167310 [anaerobic digester metagenome]
MSSSEQASATSSTFSAFSEFVMIIRNFPACTRYLISFGVNIVGQGQKTAPSLISATTKIHHSGTRGSISMTRSPFLIPYFKRMFAAPLERYLRSRKVYFLSFPSWSTQIMASLFRSVSAHRSITS